MTTDRIARVQAELQDRGVGALLVGPSADLRYLVGYHALPLERLTMLVVPAEGEPSLVVPTLEAARARAMGADEQAQLVTWEEVDDPVAVVRDLVTAAGAAGSPLALQDRLWTSFTLRLQAAIDAPGWLAGSTVMRPLRIRKTAEEVEALARVGAAIDRVHAKVPSLLAAGRTEAEVGADIADLILAEHDRVNFVIVASGPNGASPHHETSDRVIRDGDPVVVDIGGTMDDYCSDVTRNYVVGTVPDGYQELHDVLQRAQAAAVDHVRPGVTAESVDEAARSVIRDAGYGEYFVHRTGHGIGVEEHEEPWIVAGNDEVLEEGMAFSVEPGIYVPDRYGARIEDIVVVTADGVRNLTSPSHALTTTGTDR